MALWFSASAVVPALLESYPLSGFAQSLFTSAVQVGFVVGSLVSALLGLSDRLPPKGFFMASALLAALANALILTVPPDSAWVALFRFVTGLCMAGIYPVGMKLAATWAKGDMGLMVGLLVGALTLGSATPHLFNALGGVDWRFTLTAASVSALCAGLAINLMGVGPVFASAPRFRARFVLWAWKIRTIRLANFGYLGHMWELYAMWAWIGVFLQASFAERLAPDTALLSARLMTFATIGVGALGALAGGLFVTGALGIEILGGHYYDLSGKDSPTYRTLITIEETLEMLGVVVFVHALLLYIASQGDLFGIRVSTDPVWRRAKALRH